MISLCDGMHEGPKHPWEGVSHRGSETHTFVQFLRKLGHQVATEGYGIDSGQGS